MLENGNVYISKREPKYAFLLAFMFTQDKKNSHRFIIPPVITAAIMNNILCIIVSYYFIYFVRASDVSRKKVFSSPV